MMLLLSVKEINITACRMSDVLTSININFTLENSLIPNKSLDYAGTAGRLAVGFRSDNNTPTESSPSVISQGMKF